MVGRWELAGFMCKETKANLCSSRLTTADKDEVEWN